MSKLKAVEYARFLEWGKVYQYPVVRKNQFIMVPAIKLNGSFVVLDGEVKS